ncbi:NADPH-dependent FMN reductase [Haladaptatus sp. SPP-AMP-3]|uniref:NADPH-dependent FMN reductase n=1 Tax=Haladaptatus sp. SPP-AMP-3 TaxID=3121295 RepID=UPI003C2D3A0B
MTGSKPHVVALCGSLRSGSHTRTALQHVLDAATAAGATTDLVDLHTLDLSVFDAGSQDAGDAAELRRRVGAAEAIALGTPVYHGSYSSPLKTAIDYCGFDEFEGKTVGLLAVSGGASSYPGALSHLRMVAQSLHAWVLPHQVGIGAAGEVFDETGEFHDEYADIARRTTTLGREAVSYARIVPGETSTRPVTVSGND